MNDMINRDALLDQMRATSMLKVFPDWQHLDDTLKTKICLHALEVKKVIISAPAIDAVPVTRCANCHAYSRSPYGHPSIGWCKIFGCHRRPDFYCADGREKG